MKTAHTVTGQSSTITARNGVGFAYYVDFTTGSGSGSAQLQVQEPGSSDWLPADTAQTATMSAAQFIQSTALTYRWNVTVSGGTIYTYMF